MRATVYYNADGSINSLIAGEAPLGKATVQAGERLVEIDLPDIKPNLEINEVAKRLADIVDNHVVDDKSGAPRLSKK